MSKKNSGSSNSASAVAVGGSTTIADAMEQIGLKAMAEAAVANDGGLGLDLQQLEQMNQEISISEEEMVSLREKAQQERQLAEKAGAILANLQGEIAKIEADPIVRDSSVGTVKLVQLRKNQADLQAKINASPDLKARVGFTQFIAELQNLAKKIRETRKPFVAEVRQALDAAVNMKRYSQFTGKAAKYPANAIFFEGRSYTPLYEGQKSAGQLALETELSKVVRACKEVRVDAVKAGSHDLMDFKAGKPGTYYLFSPEREEKRETGPQQRYSEGHLLLEVRAAYKGSDPKPFPQIVVLDAIGGLARIFSGSGRMSIPFFWFRENRVETGGNRLDHDDFKRAVTMVHVLNGLVRVWEERQTPAATTAATTPELEDASATEPS